jgi:hypothetical protein
LQGEICLLPGLIMAAVSALTPSTSTGNPTIPFINQAVPRNIPQTGKLGISHSLQNYVVLALPSLFSDD